MYLHNTCKSPRTILKTTDNAKLEYAAIGVHNVNIEDIHMQSPIVLLNPYFLPIHAPGILLATYP